MSPPGNDYYYRHVYCELWNYVNKAYVYMCVCIYIYV